MMYSAGRFTVPFPFKPYPLQLHAMGAIREGLSEGNVVVLESPTGTGKTQVLLNGVLSHVFEPVVVSGEEQDTQDQAKTLHTQPTGEASSGNDGATHLPPKVQHDHQGKCRKRRRGSDKRHLRKSPRSDGTRDPFLVEQDLREEAQESNGYGSYTGYLSSSSSRSSSASHNGAEGEETDEDDEPQPLRKPKVYFSSRTHTQLQQVTEELRRTVFAQNLVRNRVPDCSHTNGDVARFCGDGRSSPTNEPRKLRYVHVAGRQQLCLNTSLKAAAGGSNERLNELCLEAMAYEYSREGRAARKQQQRRGHSIPFLPDIEDTLESGIAKRSGCSYCQKERLKVLRDYVNIEPRNLSQMRELGQRVGACPFLVTRELLRSADVVLIPYSYLVSPEMRTALLSGDATNQNPNDLTPAQDDGSQELSLGCKMDFTTIHNNYVTLSSKQRWDTQNGRRVPVPLPNFSGDIVVVDEAHNLVDYCRNVTTAMVTREDLQLVRCLFDRYRVQYEARLLTRNKQRLREMVAFVDKLVHHLQQFGEKCDQEAIVTSFIDFTFDAEVDTVNVHLFLSFLEESRLLPKLHGLLAQLSARMEAKPTQNVQTQDAGSKTSNSSGAVPRSDTTTERWVELMKALLPLNTKDTGSPTAALHRFETFLRWYGLSDEHTRVVLKPLPLQQQESSSLRKVALKLLQLELGAHTMFPVLQRAGAAVLAGGTMKPLALTVDLLLKQPETKTQSPVFESADTTPGETHEHEPHQSVKKVRFTEEGHVVPPSSIAVFALATGPSSQRLEFQHTRRHLWQKMFEDIGAVLLNFSHVVPAGMIVFFTSYEVEELFVNTIRSSGMYDAINAVKRIFLEPRPAAKGSNVSDLSSGMRQSAASVTVDTMLDEYAAWIQSNRSSGALLLAVMGGKLSEGINFNDDLGRAVVVVGLPYANVTEVELQLHLRHIAKTRLRALLPASANNIDHATAESGHQSTVSGDGELQASLSSSEEWSLFTDLCMRSVNQSIGRCIRHAGDYAAVILLDARFAERKDIQRRVPAWMQPSIHVAQNFRDCFHRLRDFFVTRRK